MAGLQAAMWFCAGLLLIFRMGRQNRIFYFLGSYFLFLGAWWTAGIIRGTGLFTGGPGWIFRGVTAAALAVCCAAIFHERKKGREERGVADGDHGGPPA